MKTREEAQATRVRGTLPHSAESERAVLAAILLSPGALATVRLAPADFYVGSHRKVYEAMLELERAGREIDLRTLQARLEDVGDLEKVGGLAFLAGLDLDLPDLARVETYAGIVRDRALRRRLIRECHEIARSSFDSRGRSGAALVGEAARRICALGEAGGRRGFQGVDGALRAAVDQLEERLSGPIGVRTGFAGLDRLTEGLVAGNLVIVAGRPGLGKTAFALNVAQHVAIREGLPVAFLSLEMAREEVALRILSSESGLSFREVRAARLDEREWRALYETLRRVWEAPLLVADEAATVFEVASGARRLRLEMGLALLVVDYLQLMDVGERFETRELEVSFLSRFLKRLAKELGIPVMALSQLSRRSEHRGDRRPRLADLRESGAIEQDADLVLFLHEGDGGARELIVAKHRNGATGTVELDFEAESMRFRSPVRS